MKKLAGSRLADKRGLQLLSPRRSGAGSHAGNGARSGAAGTTLKGRVRVAFGGVGGMRRVGSGKKACQKQLGRRRQERACRDNQRHVQSDGCQAERAAPSSTGSRKAPAGSV